MLWTSVSTPNEISGDQQALDLLVPLTVVAQIPEQGSFRPPYNDSNRTVRWNKANINYSALASLTPPNNGINTPELAASESYFSTPWIEFKTNWTGRYYHASRNHPSGGYGREIANAANTAMLQLQLNYSDEQKEKLLIGVLQAGIDIYGVAKEGNSWNADGGHNLGRKMLLLLTGLVLNDNDMLAYCDAQLNADITTSQTTSIFQEDQQTFYVSEKEVELTNSDAWDPDQRYGTTPYTNSDIGLPEYGVRHAKKPSSDSAAWNSAYRGVVGGPLFGASVIARLMSAENYWNWPALFDYSDRYFVIEYPSGRSGDNNLPDSITHGANAISPFAADMYTSYIE